MEFTKEEYEIVLAALVTYINGLATPSEHRRPEADKAFIDATLVFGKFLKAYEQTYERYQHE